MKIERPYAYCCAEGGGKVEHCDCVNKNHGTAWFDSAIRVEPIDRDAAEKWRDILCHRDSEYEGDAVADLAADFAHHRAAETPKTAPAIEREGVDHQREADAIVTMLRQFHSQGPFEISAESPPASGQRVTISVRYFHPADAATTEARKNAVELEQCSLFVDSDPLKKAMTDAALFLRKMINEGKI